MKSSSFFYHFCNILALMDVRLEVIESNFESFEMIANIGRVCRAIVQQISNASNQFATTVEFPLGVGSSQMD